jgi:peroxin-16
MLGPSKWLAHYEDFVTKNSSSVGQVESALRSLTYIIPGECDPITEYYRLGAEEPQLTYLFHSSGRYRESEVASECGQSTLYTSTSLFETFLTRSYSPFRSPTPVPLP